MARIRRATEADLTALLPRTLALNAHEGITTAPAAIEAALRKLLADEALGMVWLIEPGPVGYAIVTFGYDLEFAGRDAYLTELWVDESARARGVGAEALPLVAAACREAGIGALHLQVRPDNPAKRLYERLGFVASPRVVMTLPL